MVRPESNSGIIPVSYTHLDVYKRQAVGRITLPKELRKSLGFKDRELLEIYTEDDKIILRKCERQKQDIFTGSEEDLIEYKGKLVSKESIRELSKLAGLI